MKSERKLVREIVDELGLDKKVIWPRLEIVGDIAVLRKPMSIKLDSKTIVMYKKIAEILYNRIPFIRSVWLAYTPVSEVSKTRKYLLLAGTNKSETIYREFGCKFKLDIRKVYFSPRLNFEHGWFANFIQECDSILNMFAGIGFFSIIPACNKKTISYAIDLNPHAYRYLMENIMINEVEDRVYALHGDSSILTTLLSQHRKFTHVIMPYPEKALSYLPVAIKAIEKCGYLHIYLHTDIPKENHFRKVANLVSSKLNKYTDKTHEITRIRQVRTVGPRYGQYVVTVRIC
ncbi:MAG: class I SAM-dependent methyltransferase family protein [Desulfurococcales archaeon]|nr:class I SAM-dependent methyltransferase family protein [Desulfurococcales archaeon]